MSFLGSYLRLSLRPAAFLYVVFSFLIWWGVSMTMSRGFPELGLDLGIVHAFLFPALMGLLGGQMLHELQHSTFTWTLPHVTRRTLGGFVATGMILGLIMTWVLHGQGRFVVVFSVAFAGYCLGSLYRDPLGAAAPVFTVSTSLLVLMFSGAVGRQAGARPWAVVAVAGTVCGLCLWRVFSTGAFRRKPFLATKTLLTGTTVADTERYQREKIVQERRRGRSWKEEYLGKQLERWTRAAVHEVLGPVRWKDLWRLCGPLVPLAAISALHAKLDGGEAGFLEAFGKTLYHSLLRPPDMPSFTDQGEPHLLIVFLICFAGVMLGMSVPVALTPGRLYPLSRRELGRLAYRNQAIWSVAYSLAVACLCSVLVLLGGYAAGYEPRLDFVPLWLRALLWTVAVLPFGQWFYLRKRTAGRSRDTETAVARIFLALLISSVATVVVLVLALPWPRGVELLVALLAIAWGQTILRRRVLRHFETADLV